MIFDLVAGMSGAVSAPSTWTPAELFKNGEQGFWVDASDLTTMFQDSAATIPVAAPETPVGCWKSKSGSTPVMNLTQDTTSRRPLYQRVSGFDTVMVDGVDDRLAYIINVGIDINSGLTLAIGDTQSGTSTGFLVGTASNSSLVVSAENSSISVNFNGLLVHSSNAPNLGTPNVIIAEFQSQQRSRLTLNKIVTNGTAGSNDILTGSFQFGISTSAVQHKASQIVLINRLLTPQELSSLSTFISSKQ